MLKNLKSKINNKKLVVLFLFLIVLGIFFVAPPAWAATDWPTKVIGGILGILISAVGLILWLVIKALIYVASYSYFINSNAVIYGWIMVRDLCNMFFVVILLIIAFGTILHIESYNYKKWLPKLILMAILINFSKTICGLLIDVAQVVMLTFVNAFKDIGAANMTTILGIDSILKMDKNSPDPGFWVVVGAYLLGLIYSIIALIVIVTMVAMLTMRIVMIWIYVVLSPLAYLLAAFPGGQSYSSKWWKDFTSNLIVGPVLAFFIWLSFAALNADSIRDQEVMTDLNSSSSIAGLADSVGATQGADSAVIGTESSSPAALIKFVIAIGMLIGGLKISQEIGGAAGSIAAKGSAAVSKAGKMGMSGVAAATGYRYASNVAKNYSAMRKSKREESYKLGAEKLAGGIGAAKQAVGGTINKGLDWTKNKVGLNRSGQKAERLSTEARSEREQAGQMQQNFQRKEGKIGDWEYNQKSKAWQDSATGRQVDESVVEAHVDDQAKNLTNSAEQKSLDAIKFRKKQQRQDKIVKYGLMAAGAGIGLATGGVGFEAVAAMAMLGGGVGGAYAGKNKLAHAGGQDLAMGSNVNIRQITESKDKLKNEANSSVLAKMDDGSLKPFERAAAAMEAMERGILSSTQAQAKRQEIKKEIGGVDKNGDFKDKKVGSYFEMIASKKNLSATKNFEDLNHKDLDSSDPKKREVAEKRKVEAEEYIKSGIESGHYNLETLDSGAIEDLAPLLAKMMKTKDFSAQFSAMKDQGKKAEIVKTMRTEATKDISKMPIGTAEEQLTKDNADATKMEAIKKLAQIKDIDYATNDSSVSSARQQENKEAILADFSFNQLADIFNGSDTKQQNAIVNAIASTQSKVPNLDATGKVNQSGKIDIFVTAARSLNGSSPVAKELREKILAGIQQPPQNNNQNSQTQTAQAQNRPQFNNQNRTSSSSGTQTPSGIWMPPTGGGKPRS